MGIYLRNSTTVMSRGNLNLVDFEDIKMPPPKGYVYLCLTAPFNALLVVTDKREMQRLTDPTANWQPVATYIARISDIISYLPCDIKYITYGQNEER
jgi:hypothetical protein